MNRALVAIITLAALGLTGCADTAPDECIKIGNGVWVEADDGEMCIFQNGRWVERPETGPARRPAQSARKPAATKAPAPPAARKPAAPAAPRPPAVRKR